jgi:hypothetical protein
MQTLKDNSNKRKSKSLADPEHLAEIQARYEDIKDSEVLRIAMGYVILGSVHTVWYVYVLYSALAGLITFLARQNDSNSIKRRRRRGQQRPKEDGHQKGPSKS